jgi:hypothetical protein
MIHEHRSLRVTAVVIVGLCASAAVSAERGFEFRDHLGKQWERELVSYELTPGEAKAAANKRLVDAAGKEAVYQLDPATGRLLFQADVPAFGESRYRFADGKPATTTDLKVEETPQFVELSNGLTGIRLARVPSGETTQTPLLAWRSHSGEWVGAARFTEPQKIAGCDIKVTERGPVRSRAVATVAFDDGGTWTITAEMQAHEPVVKVHERFDCERPRAFRIDFTDKCPAEHALVRATSVQPVDGKGRSNGGFILRKLAGAMKPVLIVEPWVHWGGEAYRNSSFTLVAPDWKEVIFFAATDVEKWVDPTIESRRRPPVTQELVRSADGAVTLDYTLARGERAYLIGTASGDVDRANVEADACVPTVGQRCQMKHGDFPLDRVKDFVLEWPGARKCAGGFLTEEHLKPLLKGLSFDENQLARLRKLVVSNHNLEQVLPAYLVTKDATIERMLVELVLKDIQARVDTLTKLDLKGAIVTVGMAPHHYKDLVVTCSLLSTICNGPQFTDAERRKLDAQLAFLGYVFDSPAFSSVERGYAGFPNMTACALAVQAAIAGVVPGHPRQASWMKTGTGGLRSMFLEQWVDEKGEWVGTETESISYTRLTFDLVLGALYRAYASGIDPVALDHPAVRAMGRWLAGVATPRDERMLGWRHEPPVGHVYRFDMSPSQHAILAVLFKDRDPAFASHMKWMQLEQGNKLVNAVGGFRPAFAGYHQLCMANDIEPVPMRLESREWKESSVILRSHYGHELENMLYMIQGRGHSHYDMDSGSVTLWGKGEIIADDFGYYGYAPGEDQSMIDSIAANPASIMAVQAFDASKVLDYARGRKEQWTRRIMHVKHDDPAGPNYFLLHDTMASPAPAKWRMWLGAKDVHKNDRGATAIGLFRVDSDIVFSAVPPNASLSTEEKTREGYGVGGDGTYGKQKTTLTGLVLDAPRLGELLAVVYPRLKGESPPEITSIADGRGLRIATRWGTDYVFASDRAFEYGEGKLRFQGTVGFARVVDGKAVLDLKEGGTISYGDQTLANDAPIARAKDSNLYADGEMLAGEPSVLAPTKPDSVWQVSMLNESPVPGQSITGYAQRAECSQTDETKWRSPLGFTQPRIFIDPTKTYRVRVRAHVPEANRVYLGGYASSSDAKAGWAKNAKGGVWEWQLPILGPTKGFAEFETTIGPDGSGAKHTFPADAVSLQLAIRVYEKGPGVFYIDGLHFEETGP